MNGEPLGIFLGSETDQDSFILPVTVKDSNGVVQNFAIRLNYQPPTDQTPPPEPTSFTSTTYSFEDSPILNNAGQTYYAPGQTDQTSQQGATQDDAGFTNRQQNIFQTTQQPSQQSASDSPVLSSVYDLNQDGSVNSIDVGLFLKDWRAKKATVSSAMDFNRDGKINAIDYAVLKKNLSY